MNGARFAALTGDFVRRSGPRASERMRTTRRFPQQEIGGPGRAGPGERPQQRRLPGWGGISRLRPATRAGTWKAAALVGIVCAAALTPTSGLAGSGCAQFADGPSDISARARPGPASSSMPLGPAAPGAAPDAELGALTADLSRILDRRSPRSARWSVLAVSVDQGDTLFARNADELLIPASNVKILTTAAGLDLLGPDYRYRTFVLAQAPVVNGVLRGDVVLYGTGDPTLAARQWIGDLGPLDLLAQQLWEVGVRRVTGDVVGDGTYFGGDVVLDPGWEDHNLNEWYAAPSAALSFNGNLVRVSVRPGASTGAPAEVRLLPVDSVLGVANRAGTSTGRRSRVRIARRAPADTVVVSGTIGLGARERGWTVTVPDPAFYAASAFREALARRGIPVEGAHRGISSRDRSPLPGPRVWAPGLGRGGPRVLAVHESPPLLTILRVVNKFSHNQYADMVLKTLGRVVSGDGSFQGGVGAVGRFLEDGVGLAPGRVHQVDGSGLSRQNRASAGTFVKVLDFLAHSPQWGFFWKTLPEAGNPDELNRMADGPAARNLRAKTGTIRGVSALSGMVRAANGERIVFSVLVNGLSRSAAKRLEDQIGERLAAFDRPFGELPSETWVASEAPSPEATEGGRGSPYPPHPASADGPLTTPWAEAVAHEPDAARGRVWQPPGWGCGPGPTLAGCGVATGGP